MSDPLLATDLPPSAVYINLGVVVFPHKGIMVKRPFKSSASCIFAQHDYEIGCKSIKREKDVYRRLANCDGVLPYLDLSGPAIQLPWMKTGDLHSYLKQHHHSIGRSLRLSWLRQMAHALARIHDRRVVSGDVASQNVLLTPDLSILFCDFGLSSLFPLETDIWTAEDGGGFSVQTDIGELGTVMYEVVTGTQMEFDLAFSPQETTAATASQPVGDCLPDMADVWLGDVIEACWTKGMFRTTHDLCGILDAVADPDDEEEKN